MTGSQQMSLGSNVSEPAAPDSPYMAAERVFARFRANVEPLRRELEDALRAVVYDYTTSNRENRFVVGGAVEFLLGAAFRATGIPVGNLGHGGDGADLATYLDAMRESFSIKSTFSRSSKSLRLVNVQGDADDHPGWTFPTLFLVPELGIVLGHPGHGHLSSQVVRKSDAFVLPLAAVREHAASHPELVVAMDIPWDPKTGQRIASRDVARAIVERASYPHLRGVLQEDEARSELDRLLELGGMLDDGLISREDFDRLKVSLQLAE